MKTTSPQARLAREMRRLFRSMDFVSRHPALERGGREALRFAELYQQLGMVWEFLALQCAHGSGYRTNREGQRLCKVCGTVEDAAQSWMLLPAKGAKRVGRRSVPNRKKTFPNKKAATLLDDAIDFHGAKLRVQVQNEYRTKLFSKMDVTIAADRMVRLEEGGVECSFDTHMIQLRLAPRKKAEGLPYSAFPWELPRARLKRFPLMLEYDKRGKFVGVTIFKPRPGKSRPRSARRR